jgi:hypothetical protein
MKKKALVLGAKPPFTGPFTPIREAKRWVPSVDVIPFSHDVTDALKFETMDAEGQLTTFEGVPEFLEGDLARAVLGDYRSDDGRDPIVTILIEANDG